METKNLLNADPMYIRMKWKSKKLTVTISRMFFEDHMDRCFYGYKRGRYTTADDIRALALVHAADRRTVTVELDYAGFADLITDAAYYVELTHDCPALARAAKSVIAAIREQVPDQLHVSPSL